jgi:choline transport protein
MSFVFYNGGPQTFAWSILIAYLGAMAQAASLAEMASCIPIAGAQYHWANFLCPPRIRKFTTWLQGWMTWFGWVAVLAAIVNVTIIVLQAMIALQHPTYVVEGWHTACMMIAMLFLFGAVNSVRWTFRIVPWLELVAGVLHVALFVVFIVVLFVMGQRNTPDYMFFYTDISSGWDSNPYISWHLGALSCVGSFISLDGAVHMSEEVRLAKRAVPRALFWGLVLNGAMAYVMVIALLSAMGPLDEELAYAPYPASVVLMRATNSTAATTAMISGIFIISACSALGCVASVSRLTWAWARDGGLPKLFAYVDPLHLLPVRAIWLGLALNVGLALINVGSTTAFGAILSLATISLFASYGIAIFSMLLARYQNYRGAQKLQLGEWNMSWYGVYVNIFAMIYTCYMAVFLPIPAFLPVTAVTMNYSGPLFAAALIFTIVSWYVYGKRKWPGVNNEIVEIVKARADSPQYTGTA